jgi:arsenite methyltransferase
VFHPGGLALTQHLGELIGLGPADHVLDVACGRGASAVHLAERFGCHVTGLDYGPENVAAAEAHATATGVAHLTTFRQGDAERLPFDHAQGRPFDHAQGRPFDHAQGRPFDEGTFDAVISECSFCTFPDKATAAAEMARVLRRPELAGGHPGGQLGLTDMTVSSPLPDDIQNLLAWVACVAGAGTVEEYVATLQGAGFTDFVIEDRHNALLDMVADVRRKLLGLELAAGWRWGTSLGKLDLGDLDLNEAKRLARRAVELIEGGVVGYTLIAARLESKEDGE